MAIQSRQFQIQQYEFRPILNAATRMRSGAEQEIERLHPIARDVNWIRKIRGFEGMQHKLDIIGIVFNQQNVSALVKHERGSLPL